MGIRETAKFWMDLANKPDRDNVRDKIVVMVRVESMRKGD